jgi:hypothetical protein
LAAFASEALALALGLFLLTRRMTGAIASPLPPLSLAITALGLLAWAFVLRTISLLGVDTQPTRGYVKWLPAAVMLLFAVACSYPFTRWIDWCIWLPVIAVDWWSTRRIAAATGNLASRSLSAREIEVGSSQPLQQLTRFRTADGNEAIRGRLIAEFAAGERNATLYIAFCPSFEALPSVDAQIGDASSATVKVTQLLHNGAQLEVRLSKPSSSSQAVAVEFFATMLSV